MIVLEWAVNIGIGAAAAILLWLVITARRDTMGEKFQYEVVMSNTGFDLMSDREEAEVIEARVRSELAATVPPDMDPTEIVFHVFEEKGRTWIVLPTVLERTLMVAPARFVEKDTAGMGGNFGPGGPFEGKKLMLPEAVLDEHDEVMVASAIDEDFAEAEWTEEEDMEDEDGERATYH